MDLMHVAGLISPDERKFLRDVSARVEQEFEEPVIVNLGVLLGASCYCCRAGSPNAKLFGVDINGWERLEDTPEMREILNMTLLVGDTRKIYDQFDTPTHFMFVDACHNYNYVKPDIINWVLPNIVVGGYVAFHDAYYEKDQAFYTSCLGVQTAVNELMTDDWEELEKVDTIRWFRRLR